tara:strand:+ start:333 stop:494 length:162 start_codon:yes stop_codon:yes gene_type:complete
MSNYNKISKRSKKTSDRERIAILEASIVNLMMKYNDIIVALKGASEDMQEGDE